MENRKIRVAVLASGNGTNFEALAKAAKKGLLGKTEIVAFITDKPHCPARRRAKRLKIRDIFIDPNNKTREKFDRELLNILRREKVDLVVLAGYMRILSGKVVEAFKHKILNIHPALLPAFKGKDAIKRVFDSGCRLTGVTVHLVDKKVDHGPIVLQKSLVVKKGMSLRGLEERIHRLEHRLYPSALKFVINKKIKIRKGRVI